MRPPPSGEDSITRSAPISSLNRFSVTTKVSPSGSSAARTSSWVAPTVEGTTTREPGPIRAYQPNIPSATANPSATNLFRFTRLLIFFRFSTWAVVSWAFGTGIAAVISRTRLRSDLGSFLGRIGAMGISNSRLSWFFLGFSALSSSKNAPASRGRSSGLALVAR